MCYCDMDYGFQIIIDKCIFEKKNPSIYLRKINSLINKCFSIYIGKMNHSGRRNRMKGAGEGVENRGVRGCDID